MTTDATNLPPVYDSNKTSSVVAQRRLKHLFDKLQWFSSVPHNNITGDISRRMHRTSIGRARQPTTFRHASIPIRIRSMSQEPTSRALIRQQSDPKAIEQTRTRSRVEAVTLPDEPLACLINAQESDFSRLRRQLSAELLSIDEQQKTWMKPKSTHISHSQLRRPFYNSESATNRTFQNALHTPPTQSAKDALPSPYTDDVADMTSTDSTDHIVHMRHNGATILPPSMNGIARTRTSAEPPKMANDVHTVLVNGHHHLTRPSTSQTTSPNSMHNGYHSITKPIPNGSTGSQRSSVTSQRSSSNTSNSQSKGVTTLQSTGFINEQQDLVQIRMRPDSEGRYGFNVKGGRDQQHPIIVSRVAHGSSAELCYPRLNEGDQVLMINGRDCTQMSHEQVVLHIRAARESHSGQLHMTVRPNVYAADEELEPLDDARQQPQTPHVADSLPRQDLLHQSLVLLKNSLSTGAALMQFEQLFRKKPTLAMLACRLPENVNKNRYRDVSPYDATRVILKNASSGDYINANFVNMDIPAAGIVNRYIAAQGPLPHTAADFWQCIWEQASTTVVMLTTTVERGRVKCHQYWPRKGETLTFDRLEVTCVKERETASTATRDMCLVHIDSGERRLITQLQYMAWPDHGVPDDAREFIDFTRDVREARLGSMEPLLVHCSAGIGRTGVLILMETSMCLIEANEPVYPLDITRTMREQRAMMIQNVSQYKFVCDAILQAYNERLVQPLVDVLPNGSTAPKRALI